jgi:hypothetical protein
MITPSWSKKPGMSQNAAGLDVQTVQVGCPEHQNGKEVAAFDVKANWRPHVKVIAM